MIGRRTAAYFIDLAIFGVSTVLALIVGRLISESFITGLTALLIMQHIIAIPFFLLFTLITSGVVGVLLRGSVGKKLMDLRIESTSGYVTAFRLIFRDYAKYVPYIPLLSGFMMIFINRFEYNDFFITSIYVSVGLLVLVGLYQIYIGFRYQKMMLDQVFFTRVENDIPTAIEYENLSDFLKEQEKKK